MPGFNIKVRVTVDFTGCGEGMGAVPRLELRQVGMCVMGTLRTWSATRKTTGNVRSSRWRTTLSLFGPSLRFASHGFLRITQTNPFCVGAQGGNAPGRQLDRLQVHSEV